MKLKNKLFSVAAAGMLVFSNVSTAVVSANDLTTMSQETQQAIYSSQPRTNTIQTYSSSSPATVSTALSSSAVTIVNNVAKNDNNGGKSDTIEIIASKNDIIQIYDSNNKRLAKVTANSSGKAKATIKQLGASGGTIKVSVTSKSDDGKKYLAESNKTDVKFAAEAITTAPKAAVTVNNANDQDTITVTGMTAGSLVQVHSDSNLKKVLGKAKANSNGEAVIKIKDLGTSAGTVYITATDKDKRESTAYSYKFAGETKSSTVNTANVKVVNELTKKDTITVTHATASPGTVISVYKNQNDKKPFASAKTNSNGVAKISLTLDDKNSSLYITATEKNKLESDKVAVTYTLPTQTSKATAITSVNNKKSKDIVTVTGVEKGETIKIYAGTKKIGETKAKSSTATVEVTLPKAGEIIGATRTAKDMRESDMTTAAVTSVATSSAPTGGLLVNNTKGSDYVLVTGLNEGDVVTVYDQSTGGDKLGTGKVAKNETQAYVKLKNTSATTVHVSATSVDKEESATRTSVTTK